VSAPLGKGTLDFDAYGGQFRPPTPGFDDSVTCRHFLRKQSAEVGLEFADVCEVNHLKLAPSPGQGILSRASTGSTNTSNNSSRRDDSHERTIHLQPETRFRDQLVEHVISMK
jgi:hypothetical protein